MLHTKLQGLRSIDSGEEVFLTVLPYLSVVANWSCNLPGLNVFLLYPRHLCRGLCSFRLSVYRFVCSFVSSLFSFTFVELTPKIMAKVSLNEYIFLTNQ